MDAELVGGRDGGLLGGVEGLHLGDAEARPGAGLRHRALEQALGLRRARQGGHHAGAGRLAHDGDLVRITAELGDVGLDPLQDRDGVHQGIVARSVVAGFLGQLGMGQEAQGTQAVVHGDDHRALLGEIIAVVGDGGAAALGVGAAVDPHHHRPLFTGLLGPGPDVQIEAVLRHRRGIRLIHGDVGAALAMRLQAGVAELGGLEHALPRLDRHWRMPAQGADRRLAEGDALEHLDALGGGRGALDQALGRLHRLGEGRMGHGRRGHEGARQNGAQGLGAADHGVAFGSWARSGRDVSDDVAKPHALGLAAALALWPPLWAPSGRAKAMYWLGPGLERPRLLENSPFPPTGKTMYCRPFTS